MADEPIRQLLINQSMTRPIMVMGCERSLFFASALMCGYVGFNLGLARAKFLVLLAAVVVWGAVSFGLRLMGKADPYMSAVFQRATAYSCKPFQIQYEIPARSQLGTRINPNTKKRWN
jgi:type IV secretory pathway TrbD component